MIALTVSSTQPQFTQFLLERFGIEGNILTIDEARAAAGTHGSAWNDVVRAWKSRCRLEPLPLSYLPTQLPSTAPALKTYLPTIWYPRNRATFVEL